MEWQDVPEIISRWEAKTAAPAAAIRQATVGVLTQTDLGYYFHPELEKVALFAPLVSSGDQARCKAAAERAVGSQGVRNLFLTYQELADPNTCWVKVAYSPALRRIGELLNFFPGQYPGGIPNHPNPLAALLTSGLVGAGLGYGLGALGKKFLPKGTGEKLPRTGMLLGGALGAAPALVWGAANKGLGRPLLDSSLLTEPQVDFPNFSHGSNAQIDAPTTEPKFLAGYDPFLPQAIKESIDKGLQEVELGSRYKQAVSKLAESDTFAGFAEQQEPTAADVNINALGQTLWNAGASPNLAATTMGAMYAAQQMPDQRSRPNFVTGNQLGQLAMNTAGDYAKGLLAGMVLNTVVGTPFSATTYGAAGAALSLISTVVPKLLGG